MNFVYIVSNLVRRGTYWRAYEFARTVIAAGHRATLVCAHPSSKRGFTISRAEGGMLTLVQAPDLLSGGLRNGWDPWAVLARSAFLRTSEPAIVHAFECRPAVIIPALALQRRGAKLVIDWCDWFGRGGSVEERRNPLQRALLRGPETWFEERFRARADATTVISHVLAERAIALGVPPETIHLVRNGCHADYPHPDRAAARATLGLPAHAPLIIHVGSIFPRDARLMASAFDAVHAVLPEAQLLVAGYCPEPVERMVANPRAVVRTGELPSAQLELYQAAADLGWLPLSDSGANRGRWPLKLHGYVEAGLPFVTTAIGDLPAYIAEWQLGPVAAPTPAALAETSIALLRNQAQREWLRTHFRRMAEGPLSWQQQLAPLAKVYAQALHRPMS